MEERGGGRSRRGITHTRREPGETFTVAGTSIEELGVGVLREQGRQRAWRERRG